MDTLNGEGPFVVLAPTNEAFARLPGSLIQTLTDPKNLPLLTKVLMLTPYPYLCHFPVSVYLGRVTGSNLWQGLSIQALWVVLGYGLARFVWSRRIAR